MRAKREKISVDVDECNFSLLASFGNMSMRELNERSEFSSILMDVARGKRTWSFYKCLFDMTELIAFLGRLRKTW